jgi:hypothetical protein
MMRNQVRVSVTFTGKGSIERRDTSFEKWDWVRWEFWDFRQEHFGALSKHLLGKLKTLWKSFSFLQLPFFFRV